MIKKKSSIVMLPTEKLCCIIQGERSKLASNMVAQFSAEKVNNSNYTGYHLYILSDDEIKEGDWFVCATHRDIEGNITYKQIEKCTKRIIKEEIEVDILETEDWAYSPKRSKKIIATTDKNLNLPQPSQSFIKKYISEYNKGNIIEEVMVTYTIQCDDALSIGGKYFKAPMTSHNNTITISKIKDSWNKEEVIALCRKYAEDSDYSCEELLWSFDEDQWIEENL